MIVHQVFWWLPQIFHKISQNLSSLLVVQQYRCFPLNEILEAVFIKNSCGFSEMIYQFLISLIQNNAILSLLYSVKSLLLIFLFSIYFRQFFEYVSFQLSQNKEFRQMGQFQLWEKAKVACKMLISYIYCLYFYYKTILMRQNSMQLIGKSSSKDLVVRSKLFVYLLCIILSFSAFIIGYSLVNIDIVLRLDPTFHFQNQADNKILIGNVMTAIGAILGGILTKNLQAILHDNRLMILSDCIAILAFSIMSSSFTTPIIIISRLILGFSFGLTTSILPKYLLSLSPLEIRGMICSIYYLMGICGMAFSYLMSLNYQSLKTTLWESWQVLFYLPTLYCLIHIFILYMLGFNSLYQHFKENDQQSLKEYSIMFYKSSNVSKLVSKLKYTKEYTQDEELPQPKLLLVFAILALLYQFNCSNIIYDRLHQLIQKNFTQSQDKIYGFLFVILILQICACIASGVTVSDKISRKYIIINGCYALSILYILELLSLDTSLEKYIIFLNLLVYSSTIGPVTFLYVSQSTPHMQYMTIVFWGNYLFLLLVPIYFTSFALIATKTIITVVSAYFLCHNLVSSENKSFKQIDCEYKGENKDERSIYQYENANSVREPENFLIEEQLYVEVQPQVKQTLQIFDDLI